MNPPKICNICILFFGISNIIGIFLLIMASLSDFELKKVIITTSNSFQSPSFSTRCVSLVLAEACIGPLASFLVVEMSLDRLSVWERSVKSGVGVPAVFALEILCKHVFLWVCACNYGLPSLPPSLCFSCYLGHCDILTIWFLLFLRSHHCLQAGVSLTLSFFFFCPPPL